MTNSARTVLLCAGDIGYQAASTVLGRYSTYFAGLVTYEVEPPQDVFLSRLEELASEHDLPFFDLSGRERHGLTEVWDTLRPDLALVLKWRTLIGRDIIERTPDGVVVFHASLLPKYRGFAPIPWPLINGESETGLTMFYASEEVDAGDIVHQQRIQISPTDDAASLEQKIASAACSMLSNVLPSLLAGTAPREAQDHAAATYSIWRRPEDGEIDWSRSSTQIHDLVRGLTFPYPGAFTTLDGKKLTIWSTSIPEFQPRYIGAIPGKVESVGEGRPVRVLTGDGLIELGDVELEDGGRLPSWQVVRRLYTRFGGPA